MALLPRLGRNVLAWPRQSRCFDGKLGYNSEVDANGPLRWNILESIAFRLSDGDPTLQGRRDRLLGVPAHALIRLGFSADSISVLGLFLAICSSFLMDSPAIAALLLTLSLLCDGLDGVVARLSETATARGEILDIFCDTAGVLFVMAGLTVVGSLEFTQLLFYSVVLVAYTITSSVKSRMLIGKYRSIGSRVLVTAYVVLCLAIDQFEPGFLRQKVTLGVVVVTIVLIANLAMDGLFLTSRLVIARSRMR
ncbi:CDP-alcohol phosphatidyltransferase family protein [Bradyrhizobium sp. UNPF46]|uniref:CDP-alcohol phosphatidyltransferase family protein n=1 Tax=Bradyrhizobium sp. UNPF46 TaxID=1141168 RepID=UPI00115263B3|nr:CDP-alcohol phosphatidyltransferase family protein [Bradyrhizobium sp. UNPF46]